MEIDGFLPIQEQIEINPKSENDYIDDEGLQVCGICGKRKQCKIEFGGSERIVPCLCKCGSEVLQKRKEQDEYEEQMRRISRLREASMMDQNFRGVTFDRYDVRGENQEAYTLSKKYAEKFCEMYQKNQGILFYGPVGTGKSFTAACIANYLLDNAKSVIMTSFVKILQDIWDNNREAEYITILNSASLLIIDDLGTERDTDYALEKVYNVIDSRVRASKPMIITTNLSLETIMECDDIRKKRIYDRILECCYPVYVGGKSFRMLKAADRFDEMKEILEG